MAQAKTNVIASGPALGFLGSAPHIMLPFAPRDTSFAGPASVAAIQNTVSLQANPAPSALFGGGKANTNVIPKQPAGGLVGQVIAWISSLRQAPVHDNHVGVVGSVNSIPSILGGVQGFTMPPGVPNSVSNRY